MHVKDAWLKQTLAEHAKLLSDSRLYKKGHNHGIDQDIALMGIGCRYGRKDWTSRAVKRLTGTVKLDVDSQGALMEQAPRYAVYVHSRLMVAMPTSRTAAARCPARSPSGPTRSRCSSPTPRSPTATWCRSATAAPR